MDKFNRLASPYDLRVAAPTASPNPEISILEGKIAEIKGSYGYHGLSPLNDAPAPSNPETLAQLDRLEQTKYALELREFFNWAGTVLSRPEDGQTLLQVTHQIYWLTQELGQHQPEQVRQNLGDQYVPWLENTVITINQLGGNSPQSLEMVDVLKAHLDVTGEYAYLRHQLDQMLVPAIFGMTEPVLSTTAV